MRGVFGSALLVAAWLGAPNAWALDITPSVLIIDAEDHSAALLLRNGADVEVDVDVDLRFGFEIADANGNVREHFPAQPTPDHRSAAPFLEVSPRRSRLEPGEERIARIQVRLPADLPQGEYWAIASVRADPVIAPNVEPSERIRLRVGATAVQTIPVFVRNGRAAATVHIQDVAYSVENRHGTERLVARYFVGLEGSGAFLGSVQAVVQRANGDVIGHHEVDLAVFESGWRRIEIPLDRVPADGARLELQTRRRYGAIRTDALLPGGETTWSSAFASR